MFIRTSSSKLSKQKAVQIVESYRNPEGKPRLRIVAHIGMAKDDEELKQLSALAESIKQNLEAEKKKLKERETLPLFPIDEHGQPIVELSPYSEEMERELVAPENLDITEFEDKEHVIDGPFEVVEWLWQNLGLKSIFADKHREASKDRKLKQLIAGMLAKPSSKKGISEWLAENYAADVSLDSIYRLMDALSEKEGRVREVVRRNSESLTGKPSLMLFDVTTLYFESFDHDEFRIGGYSKDNKFKETQVVLALAVTPEGLPLWYDLFPGNTFEGKTFSEFVKHFQTVQTVQTVQTFENSPFNGVVVADAGMFSTFNLDELKAQNLSYVMGTPLKRLNAEKKAKILDTNEYKTLSSHIKDADKEDALKYRVIDNGDGTRILATWSAKRARKNAHDREVLIERLQKKLNAKGELKEQNGNRGTAKYLKRIGDESSYVLDEEKIRIDAQWDGIRGVTTDLPLEKEADVEEVLSHYGSLWKIEESFRISKTDMKIRPIYHWTEIRIRAHILLSYLVFACMRYLERRVELLGKEHLSAAKLQKAMLSVQSALMLDKGSGRVFRFPKRLSELSEKLYKSLGIRRGTRPKELLNVRKYKQDREMQ